MPNHGGRYVMRNGKRELVQRTKPAPDPQPKASATPQAKSEPKPATKPAAKQSGDVKEADNG